VDALFNAVESFFSYFGAIAWGPLLLAILCHLAKTAARGRAWRNIIAAAYPQIRIPFRTVLGSYVAGVGVNAIIPARGGDVLRLFLVKHRVGGVTYPTLGSTLVVEAVFDTVVALLLLFWALQLGALPGLDVIPRLPGIDWLWLFQNPQVAAVVTAIVAVAAFVFGVWASKHIDAFRARVAQGFAVMRSPRRYLTTVATWQAIDWAFRLATIYFFLRAFGIAANVENALLVQVTQSLASILPLTPSGIGTEQALLAYVLRGEAPTTALLSFSVGMRLVLIVVNVAIGFAAIALMLRTLRWRDAMATVEPETVGAEAETVRTER
jgi:uncharacterized membrane protein YbhN (UPF0104 family)